MPAKTWQRKDFNDRDQFGRRRYLQQKLGTTTVYVTHDQAEAMTLGHRVAVMNQGRLQQFNTPLAIYNQPKNLFVAGFVGSPTMNFLEGDIDLGNRAFVNQEFTLAFGESDLESCQRSEARRLTLGIRSEHIQLSLAQRSGWHQASVYVTELMGSETFVTLQIGTTKLTARAPGDFRAATDSPVWFDLDVTRAHWFDPGSGERI